MRHILTCLTFLCVGASLRAEVVPAPVFTDHAVLQRDKKIPVWGTADPGETITVTLADQTVATTADANGAWRVDLPPRPASDVPANLVIQGDNTCAFSDILVGEVWLASGQSNMEWALRRSADAAVDIPASAHFPLIRHLAIGRNVANEPIATATGSWQVAGPKTSGHFTAVGYYFARDLYTALKVPVGIIHSSWGGSAIEVWMPPPKSGDDPRYDAVVKRRAQQIEEYPAKKTAYHADLAAWTAEASVAKAKGIVFTKPKPVPPRDPLYPSTPHGLYNGMISPVIPYALRGVIWYQGGSNVTRASQYHGLFVKLITEWRARFGQGDFPFYWVQLANFNKGGALDDDTWAFLREAQTKTLIVPVTGQAITIDIGDPKNIHPLNKKDVGNRLARLALARTYHRKIVDSGPVFAKAEREGSGFRVTFTEVHGGLRASDDSLVGFELAGRDKVFHSADARIENNTVVVSSPAVPEPIAVRYAWHNAPAAGLFNNEGLPAVPFRSDSW